MGWNLQAMANSSNNNSNMNSNDSFLVSGLSNSNGNESKADTSLEISLSSIISINEKKNGSCRKKRRKGNIGKYYYKNKRRKLYSPRLIVNLMPKVKRSKVR